LALPIAHAAAGYLVHRVGGGTDRPRGGFGRAAALMIVANLPDADFLVGFVLGRPGMLHRGASHTVLAAVLFGVAAGAFVRWRWRERFAPTALLFGAAYLSHLLLDALTIDSRPPAGGQFLWPFSSEYVVAPITFFTEIYIDGHTRESFLRSVLDWPTIVVLARELVIAIVAIGGWHLVELAKGRVSAARATARTLVSPGTEEDLA
jgi:inner membrane protein